MKRSGFTMIELIFVIVILGILAAVAIPKLAATREDAQVTNLKATVKQAANSVPSHFTAQTIASFKGAMAIETSDVTTDLNVFRFTDATECEVTFEDNTGDTIEMAIVQDTATAPASCVEGVRAVEDNLSLLVTYTFASDGVVSQVAELNNITASGDTERIVLGGRSVDRR